MGSEGGGLGKVFRAMGADGPRAIQLPGILPTLQLASVPRSEHAMLRCCACAMTKVVVMPHTHRLPTNTPASQYQWLWQCASTTSMRDYAGPANTYP